MAALSRLWFLASSAETVASLRVWRDTAAASAPASPSPVVPARTLAAPTTSRLDIRASAVVRADVAQLVERRVAAEKGLPVADGARLVVICAERMPAVRAGVDHGGLLGHRRVCHFTFPIVALVRVIA